MTTEEKQLLLIDLCARLPYGIIVRVHDIQYGDFDSYVDSISNDCIETYPVKELTIDFNPCVFYKLQEIKPYLRSMNSMTNEELIQYKCMNDALDENYEVHIDNAYPAFDWLNKKMFDFRGLIDKGLALETPEEMYK